jgi:hypothetical protein
MWSDRGERRTKVATGSFREILGIDNAHEYDGERQREGVVRTWSIQFPWLDRPDSYRSGLPRETLAAHFAGTIRKKFVQMQNPCDVACRSSGITRSPYKEKKQGKT